MPTGIGFTVLFAVGVVGVLLIGWRLLQVFWLVNNPRLTRIAWKTSMFFFGWGFSRLLGWMIEQYLLPEDWNGFVRSVFYNIGIYWLYFYVTKHKKRLEEPTAITDTSSSLSGDMLEILRGMKNDAAQIRRTLQEVNAQR